MPEPDRVTGFAGRLRALRLAAGLTQQQLANHAGVAQSVVTAVEQGRKADVRATTALALARALGVSVERLLAG